MSYNASSNLNASLDINASPVSNNFPDSNAFPNSNGYVTPQPNYNYPYSGIQENQPIYHNNPGQNYMHNEPNGLAIASLVLGIVSIIAAFCYGIVGFICGILAIIFACVSRPKDGPFQNRFSCVACGGLVTGIISASLGLIMFIIGLITLSTITSI